MLIRSFLDGERFASGDLTEILIDDVLLRFSLISICSRFTEQLFFTASLFLLLSQFLRVDVQTTSPNPFIHLLLALRVIRVRLGLLNLLEVATLLLDLLFEELTADAQIRVVQNLVKLSANLNRSLLQEWIQLVNGGQGS